MFENNHFKPETVVETDLERYAVLKQQIADAKRTGDMEYLNEIEPEFLELQRRIDESRAGKELSLSGNQTIIQTEQTPQLQQRKIDTIHREDLVPNNPEEEAKGQRKRLERISEEELKKIRNGLNNK